MDNVLECTLYIDIMLLGTCIIRDLCFISMFILIVSPWMFFIIHAFIIQLEIPIMHGGVLCFVVNVALLVMLFFIFIDLVVKLL